jgi:P27 family predicted phage terminase small subunit
MTMNRKQPTTRAPSNLGHSGREFWKKISAEFVLESHHSELLAQACKSLDRISTAREVLDKDGLTFIDKFGQIKPHPAVAIELANKTIFARLLRELGLDVSKSDTRPPRVGGSRY